MDGFTAMDDGSLERWDRVTADGYTEWGYHTRIVDPGNDRWFVECEFGLLNEHANGWSARWVAAAHDHDRHSIAFRYHHTNCDDAGSIANRLLSDELSSWHMLDLKEITDG